MPKVAERSINKLPNGPGTVHHTQRLRWRRLEGFMDAAEVVVRNVQRDCRNVIIKFLGEAIGKTAKSALAYAEGKVLPLNVAGRDVLFRVAGYYLTAYSYYGGGRVEAALQWLERRDSDEAKKPGRSCSLHDGGD